MEIVRTACVAQREPPGLLCDVEGIRGMGLGLLDAQEARKKAEVEIRFLEERLRVADGVQRYEMDRWHRQWWLMVPLGVLSGIALTFSVQLALGR